MVSFESLEIGVSFMFEGEIFTKQSALMARSANGEWIADTLFQNPMADSYMVQPV
jgi:hypothetical protein